MDAPSAFVDAVMMTRAQRNQVVEVGRASVLPPDDMVRLGVVESDGAARHGAAWVQRPQRPPLGATGETRSSTEVHLTGRVQHHAVAYNDRRSVGSVLEQLTQHSPRQLDRYAPFDVWRWLAPVMVPRRGVPMGPTSASAIGFGGCCLTRESLRRGRRC